MPKVAKPSKRSIASKPRTSSQEVYIVIGYTEDYGDYMSWDVHAYLDKKMAQKHADAAKAEVDRIFDQFTSRPMGEDTLNKYDPTGEVSATTTYSVTTVKMSKVFKKK